jgi:MYXO-CTERM domain-containing protein
LVCANTSEILFCDGTTYATANCSDEAASGATCGTMECIGSACPEESAQCVGNRGGDCIGIGTLFDGDSSNDNLLMAVPCAGNNACVATNAGESCEALPAGVSLCAPGDADYCAGDNLVLCINYGSAQAVLPSPGVLDCASLGLVCSEESGSPTCVEPTDARCGTEGFGSCIDNVATFCSDGTPTGSTTDCSTTGQACVDGGGTPRCVTADPECGALGVGSCSGTVATICVDAVFQNTTDCSTLGRRCGADADGQIGCITSGGGEGEGEGEPECQTDSDCDDDETCEDGECERPRSSRTTDEEEPAAGLFGCSSAGGALFPAAAVLTLVLRRRRRA